MQSKKSKSYKKGTSLVDDTGLFDDGDTAPTTAAADAISEKKRDFNSLLMPPPLITGGDTAPTPAAADAISEKKRDSNSLPMPPPLITSSNLLTGTDPFSNLMPVTHGDDGWEGSDFFKEDPFAPSPFETDFASGDNGGKDAFGFPTKQISDGVMGNKSSRTVSFNANPEATNTFFDLDINGADSWVAPTAIPVDITPRRDNAARHFNDHRHVNDDANSCDESEMSEVTDPTFSSSLIMQSNVVMARLEPKGGDPRGNDKNIKTSSRNTVDNSDSSIKENHNSESRQHSGGRKKNLPSSSVSASPTEKHAIVKSEVNVDPPLVSLDTIESSEDERENKNRDLDDQVSPPSTLPVAKSRILSKYAKSGKVRRAAAYYSSSVDNDKTEPQSSARPIDSVGSSSLNSRTGNLRNELDMSPARTSKTPISADPRPQSSDRSIGSVGSSSLNSRFGNRRQELDISPARTSKTLVSADPRPQSSARSIGSAGSISLNSSTGKLGHELEISPARTSKTLISADPGPQSSARSIGSAGFISLNSRTVKLGQELEISPAMTSKTLISADPGPQSSARSIGSVGSISLNSRTGKLGQELERSPVKTPKTLVSADLNSARKDDATATSAAASAIALAAVPSISSGASRVKQQQQQPHSQQQGINPATASSLYRRRQSPIRASTSSTAGNTNPVKSISPPSRSPVRKYISPNRKKKVSPSAVENPAYYSVRVSHFIDPHLLLC